MNKEYVIRVLEDIKKKVFTDIFRDTDIENEYLYEDLDFIIENLKSKGVKIE